MFVKNVIFCVFLGMGAGIHAQETQYFYLRPADYQCLVNKARLYAQTKTQTVNIVLADCPNFPKQSITRNQYPPAISKGRNSKAAEYPDEVIPLSKNQLKCLNSKKRPRPVTTSTGYIKLQTNFGCN